MDPQAQEDTAAADEETGSLRAAGLVAVAVLREAPEVDLDLVVSEAPAALVDLEAQAAVAQEAGHGEIMVPAEDEGKDSLRLVVEAHRPAETQVEVVVVRLASGLRGRIGVGLPIQHCWIF